MRRFLYKLVNKASIWRRLNRDLRREQRADSKWIPDITISREPGSGDV
jgi:hypothetical protein